ncbi:MAG: methyltransferase domain-containing protein [Deltaproteobacteria bacterium]|nr:methyltransferase domain-containing protein [Deltaproteobacteria bacterium]
MALNHDRAKELSQKVAADAAGAFAVGLAYIGRQTGLFDVLSKSDGLTSAELASACGLNERYVREWLRGMVAAEYIDFQVEGSRYYLNETQKSVITDQESPFFTGGVFQFVLPSLMYAPRLMECFHSGGGISFSELGPEIAAAIDLMHRPWFDHLLTNEWLPAVAGLSDKLAAGIKVLDVGCGLGRSSIAVARAYPNCNVTGIDPHSESIERGIESASQQGVKNLRLEAAALEMLPHASEFDLVLAIDSIHDMPDPVAALSAVKALLKPGGQVFWSEPAGSENPLENRNLPGKLRANLSPFHCLTVSLACRGAGLGAIMGESKARELASAAGFKSFNKLEIVHPMQVFYLLQ